MTFGVGGDDVAAANLIFATRRLPVYVPAVGAAGIDVGGRLRINIIVTNQPSGLAG
jgi:hypothetical protein